MSGYVPFNAIAGNFTRIRVRQTGGRRGLGHEARNHLMLNSRPLIGHPPLIITLTPSWVLILDKFKASRKQFNLVYFKQQRSVGSKCKALLAW